MRYIFERDHSGKYVEFCIKDTATARGVFRKWAKIKGVFSSVDIRHLETKLQKVGVYKGTMSLGRYARLECGHLLERVRNEDKDSLGFALNIAVYRWNNELL